MTPNNILSSFVNKMSKKKNASCEEKTYNFGSYSIVVSKLKKFRAEE